MPVAAAASPAPDFDASAAGSTNDNAAAKRLPAWINLPTRGRLRRSGDYGDGAAPAQLEALELAIGRTAMVAATALLCKELFTGESVLDQVGDVAAIFHL